MPTLEEKRTELNDELIEQPSNIVLSRLDTIEKAILAVETMGAAGNALAVDEKQNIIFQLASQLALIRGAQISDILKFNFNTAVNYSLPLSFTLPTVLEFGYQIIDDDGNEITLSDTPGEEFYFGNFYLTKDLASPLGSMVNLDDNQSPYITPNLEGPATETIDDRFGSQKTTFVRTLVNTPNKKISPLPSLDIILSDGEGIIGHIDEFGIVTNASGFDYLDEDNSIFDFGAKQATLIFLTSPTGIDKTITLSYDYQASQDVISEEFDGTLVSGPTGTVTSKGSFNGDSFIFSKTLAEVPVIPTIEVFQDDVKIVGFNNKNRIVSMLTNSKTSKILGATITLEIAKLFTDKDVVLRYDYIRQDTVSATEQIGGFDLTSDTYTQTLSNPTIDIESLIVKIDDTIVATTAFDGEITGSYTGADAQTNTISGTITGAGALSLTLTAPSDTINTESLEGLSVEYNFVTGLSTWLGDWEQLEISNIRQDVISDEEPLNIIELNTSAGGIDNPPKLLGTYPLKKHSNEQIIGNLIVVTEGLEINTDWVPIYVKRDGVLNGDEITLTSTAVGITAFSTDQLIGATLRLHNYDGNVTIDRIILSNTGSIIVASSSFGGGTASNLKFEVIFAPEDATKMSDDSFKPLFNWLDPDTTDDLIISSRSDIVSDGQPPFANIETNPFRPATEGEHANQQPSGLDYDDIFAGFYANFTGTPGFVKWKWSVHNDLKWINDPDPENDTTREVGDVYRVWEDNSAHDPLEPDMDLIRTGSLNATTTIPANSGAGVEEDVYFRAGDKIWFDEGSGNPGGNPVAIEFPCKQNDVQDILDSITTTQILALETLRLADEFIDSIAPSAEDALFWDDVETIAADLNAMSAAHTEWLENIYQDNIFDTAYDTDIGGGFGNPSELADTFEANIKDSVGSIDFYAILFTSGRQETIETRIGTATGIGYAADVYNVMNGAAGNTIGWVKDVMTAYLSISANYDNVTNIRTKYRFYDNAIED